MREGDQAAGQLGIWGCIWTALHLIAVRQINWLRWSVASRATAHRPNHRRGGGENPRKPEKLKASVYGVSSHQEDKHEKHKPEGLPTPLTSVEKLHRLMVRFPQPVDRPLTMRGFLGPLLDDDPGQPRMHFVVLSEMLWWRQRPRELAERRYPAPNVGSTRLIRRVGRGQHLPLDFFRFWGAI